MARRSMGRQKIAMTKISKESNLMVTFSKRRSGLFKKACELSVLCGAKMAIIVFSPTKKKVYSIGHPYVEDVVNKFLSPDNPSPAAHSGVLQPMQAHVMELNTHLGELRDLLETQMAYGESLRDVKLQRQGLDLYASPVGELGLEQLQSLKSGLAELKTSVVTATNNLLMMQQAQNLTSVGGEPADFSDPAELGIVMPPLGYAFF